LRDLKATDGVYVISGNHEYIFGYSTWMAHFAELGLLSLENRHIVLDRDGSKLVLAGITDRASRRTGHLVRSRVLGIGPQIGFLFPVGDMQGYVNLKGYGEFDAANRASGWNTWLTFSISPMAPTSTVTTRRITK
jgi:hypothetical protein